MKKVMALIAAVIFILSAGCSSSKTESSRVVGLTSNGAVSSDVQSTQASSSTIPESVSPAQSLSSNPPVSSSKVSSTASQINIENEGNQIDITGSNTPGIPNAECLEPYHIGFNMQNISKKPITKVLIRATDLGGCAIDVDDSLSQLPLNKNYRGTEWDYTGTIEPKGIGLCDLYVIPKQLSYQTLTFQFFMADGKTSFRDANNNPAIVKVRFGINGGDPIPNSEPFNATDIDVGGKLVYSRTDQNYYIVFDIKNTAYFSDLNGVMFRIPAQDYAGYKIETIQGGTVDIENGYYVWKFSQVLARRSGEDITINCPLSKPPKSGFDFYTLDGKTKISTCQITSS